jgi:ER-bound oxygenase mpaB/B'/Rubber oxygenase, catalytic domain
MNNSLIAAPDDLLDRMQYQADPLADRTIAAILGQWHQPAGTLGAGTLASTHALQWKRLEAVNSVFADWKTNSDLEHWHADPKLPPEVAGPLQDYVREARALPAWADHAAIDRAEQIFLDHGVLSCTLLFCASLPECYVVPDLSEVLHQTGQLERRTEYRIRSTAAMVFPLMMRGGLNAADGGGLAQVLKVRLIHATVRHLILRGSPQEAVAALGSQRKMAGAGVVAPMAAATAAAGDMHQALFIHGWKLGEDGLPCNQEELAYTLLTFGYVFLRGLRTLGVGLERRDEEAYLHAWNVVGHVIGIERELMADTMDEAAALFARMQARGRAEPVEPDPRPELGRALVQSMARIIPLRLFKPFPALLTRHLCGPATASDIGLDQHVSWWSRAVFALCLLIIGGIDRLVRLFVPGFSISRFITRLVGYQLMTRFLMDQTRPLKLPEHVLQRAHGMMSGWGNDPRAPGWLNRLEARCTLGRKSAMPA